MDDHTLLKEPLWWCSIYGSCFYRRFYFIYFSSFASSVSYSLQFKCYPLWDMLGTIFLYFVCFEFSHLLFHLLMESIFLPCCISKGDIWVLGCRCFAFFEASESASSFSSIPWWFCTFGLMSVRFSQIALTVELW